MDLTLASLCHANFAAGGFGRGEGEVGMGDLSPPPILLYTTIWLNILIYTILLSRFDLTGRDLWFIYNEILEFHNWIVCYHEHFQHKLRRWKSLELKMDLWHLTDMKVILTLQILNFAESCAPFSCIDSFAFDEIKWLCAFTKHTTQKSITKSHELILPTSVSCSWYYLHTSIESIWY